MTKRITYVNKAKGNKLIVSVIKKLNQKKVIKKYYENQKKGSKFKHIFYDLNRKN